MPETRSKNFRSPIWKHFEPVDSKTTKCLLCDQVYKNSGNTTNLTDHMKRRHREEYEIIQAELEQQLDENNQPDEVVHLKYEENDEIEQSVREIVEHNDEQGDDPNEMIESEETHKEFSEEGQNSADGHQVVKIIPLPHARSEVWNYFGFIADEDSQILDRTKVVCKLCASTFCYSGNTTNFYSHLKSMHSEVQIGTVLKTTSRAIKRNYTVFNETADNFQEFESDNNELHAKLGDVDENYEVRNGCVFTDDITKALVEFLVTDCRPVSVVKGKGFQKLLRLLVPDYSMPEHYKLMSAVRKRYDEVTRDRPIDF